jgi:hypothetical protein
LTRKQLAGNPKASPQILSDLAKDKDWTVRAAVAANSKTPISSLSSLMHDREWTVRRACVSNPQADLSVLREDENNVVRREAKERAKRHQ